MLWPLLGGKEKTRGFSREGVLSGVSVDIHWKGKQEHTEYLSNPISWAWHGWSQNLGAD